MKNLRGGSWGGGGGGDHIYIYTILNSILSYTIYIIINKK